MASVSYAAAAEGEYYCPPGAKFCPAPGANNTAFLDTHFGIDAQTGQVSAFNGSTNHLPPNDRIATAESVILVAPNVSPENRYVPPEVAFGPSAARPAYPAQPVYAPQPAYQPPVQNVATQSYQQIQYSAPQPQPYQAQVYQGYPKQAVGTPTRHIEATSEVANQQASRPKAKTANNDKVPWWKGGMWRNKKDGDNGSSRDSSSSSGSSRSNSYDDSPSPSSGGRGASSSSRMADDDSMWDDDDYSGYNSDGSFGRPAGAPQQARQPAPANSQYADPYSPPPVPPATGPVYNDFGNRAVGSPYGPPAPAPTYSDPFAPQPQPMAGGYIGEPYTDPNYAQPYGGSTYSDPYASQPAYAGPAYSDPYAPTTPDYGSPYDSGTASWVGATQNDPWGGMPVQAAPSFQGTPSIDAQGSPQFENAVRMVKENRFSEAKNILVSETSRNPSNAAAWRWLADCHYNLLELDDAINCYKRALERDPNDYYALRGEGFSYLHRGHEFWRRMQEEVGRGQKDPAAATFAQAHENYKQALDTLGRCLRRAPTDSEAIYGEAMAAEGASRKLYSNAISYLKLGPEHRERAELFAENCLTVINKGIERSKERAKLNPGDAGPRALLGGLYLRKAILYNQLGKNDLALLELRNSRDVQQSILDEIDKNNDVAQKNIRECETYWNAWGGNRN